jgi:hypothetical protein
MKEVARAPKDWEMKVVQMASKSPQTQPEQVVNQRTWFWRGGSMVGYLNLQELIQCKILQHFYFLYKHS